MDKTSLGDRMKRYEATTKSHVLRRTPVIIRIDGKAFHTFTKRFQGPFDDVVHDLMTATTELLVRNIQNATLGYTQSDEISILLNDWKTLETDQWFGGSIQKIASVAASMTTGYFNAMYHSYVDATVDQDPDFLYETAFFDARVFNVPKEEVTNYFIWRQQDASRNSVQMLGREYFSHKQLHKKSNSEIQDMLMLKKGVNWNDLDVWKRRGSCVVREVKHIATSWVPTGEAEIVTNRGATYVSEEVTDVTSVEKTRVFIDNYIPIFTKDRDFIEKHL